jgi:hypothetical protein
LKQSGWKVHGCSTKCILDANSTQQRYKLTGAPLTVLNANSTQQRYKLTVAHLTVIVKVSLLATKTGGFPSAEFRTAA